MFIRGFIHSFIHSRFKNFAPFAKRSSVIGLRWWPQLRARCTTSKFFTCKQASKSISCHCSSYLKYFKKGTLPTGSFMELMKRDEYNNRAFVLKYVTLSLRPCNARGQVRSLLAKYTVFSLFITVLLSKWWHCTLTAAYVLALYVTCARLLIKDSKTVDNISWTLVSWNGKEEGRFSCDLVTKTK